jgi:lysozyme
MATDARKAIFDLVRSAKGGPLTADEVEIGDKWLDGLGIPRPEKETAGLRISNAGLELIKQFEGCQLTAYKCPAGVWSIGFGHTQGVKRGQTITQFEADELLRLDVEDHDITPYLDGVPTSQNQFDAMSSLAFNIGLTRFANSTVLKRHKLGNKLGAANAFLMWKLSNGKVLPGLVRRREAERKLYLGE